MFGLNSTKSRLANEGDTSAANAKKASATRMCMVSSGSELVKCLGKAIRSVKAIFLRTRPHRILPLKVQLHKLSWIVSLKEQTRW